MLSSTTGQVGFFDAAELIGPLPEGYCYISVTGRHGQGRKPFVGVLKGLGIETLLPHYLSLLGLGAALFILSAWLYKKQAL